MPFLQQLCLYDFCMESEIPVFSVDIIQMDTGMRTLKDETVSALCCADFETDEKDRFRIAGMQPYGSNGMELHCGMLAAVFRTTGKAETAVARSVMVHLMQTSMEAQGKKGPSEDSGKAAAAGVFFQAAAISDKEAIQKFMKNLFWILRILNSFQLFWTKKLLRFIRR